MFFILVLESWKKWRSIYADNKKFVMRAEKVKEVYRLLPKTTLYYNYLENQRKEYLKKKKSNIGRRTSMNAGGQGGFEIHEIRDGDSNQIGSEYSSVKKESVVNEDPNQGTNMQSEIRPQQMQDYKEFEMKSKALHPIFEGLKEYAKFEMPENEIRMIMADSKNAVDKAYGDYMMGYKRCFGGKFPPMFLGPEKKEEKTYDWNKMKQAAEKTQKRLSKAYDSVQKFYKKKIGLEGFKSDLGRFDEGELKGFKIESFKKAGVQVEEDTDNEFDINSNDLRESEIRETKEPPKKENLDFDIEEEGDVFGTVSPKKDKKATTFEEDMKEDAFEGFNPGKKVGFIYFFI